MAILVSDVISLMRSSLDAEGADYYNDTRDFIPAINLSVDWIVSLIGPNIGSIKFPEEQFRELTSIKVFQTNEYSRISLDKLEEAQATGRVDVKVWTILAVYPNPTVRRTIDAFPQIIDAGTPEKSIYRGDMVHISASESAKRLTLEEWNTRATQQNPFAPGYEGSDMPTNLKEYAYLSPLSYKEDNGVITGDDPYLETNELEIRPIIANGLVSLAILRSPTPVSLVTDNIKLPEGMTNIVYEKALSYVARKQGDQTSIYGVSERDVANIFKSLNS